MLRVLLFLVLGIIVWRMIRIAVRSVQTPGKDRREDPFASTTPPKRKTDLGDIQDADFEDITDKTPPKNPPPEP